MFFFLGGRWEYMWLLKRPLPPEGLGKGPQRATQPLDSIPRHQEQSRPKQAGFAWISAVHVPDFSMREVKRLGESPTVIRLVISGVRVGQFYTERNCVLSSERMQSNWHDRQASNVGPLGRPHDLIWTPHFNGTRRLFAVWYLANSIYGKWGSGTHWAYLVLGNQLGNRVQQVPIKNRTEQNKNPLERPTQARELEGGGG